MLVLMPCTAAYEWEEDTIFGDGECEENRVCENCECTESNNYEWEEDTIFKNCECGENSS